MSRAASALTLVLRAPAVLGATVAVGLAAGPRPVSSDVALRGAVATALARETGLVVDAAEVSADDDGPPSLRDAVVGRGVVFAARARAGAPRDIYSATVRWTPTGRVIAVHLVRNLTRSPLGDDGPLVAARGGGRVAFATRAFGQVQSVSVLDLRGSDPSSWRDAVTRVQETGRRRGVARWDLRLDRAVRALDLRFEGGALGVASRAGRWRFDPARGVTEPAEGVTVAASQRVEKPAVIWAVDTVRGLSFVGPAPITWLEHAVFTARDRWRRVAWRYLRVRPREAEPVEPAGPSRVATTEGNTLAAGARDASDPDWPPPDIAPQLGDRERGEGTWTPATPSWSRVIDGAPPAFYRTRLRLDAERPYADVVLVAMDMRQLQLGMQADVEDPVPLVGPRGDGRIPRRPEVMENLVGAFNGAFKTEHGSYGMVVEGRVLLPPRAGAATVATLDDGRVAMGTWEGVETLPAVVRSLRQNLDPLVADGVENPTRRRLWGFVLGGIETMPTVRSALCADRRGHMIYAWGEETTARHLARALRLAGCDYAMHLDMNPTHATFHFLRVDDVATRQFRHQPLSSAMHVSGDRFLYYTLKDFFYLTLRPARWPALNGAAWTARGLPQPAPAWMPAIQSVDVPLDAGRALHVTSMADDRVSLRLRAGREEPGAPPDSLTTLPAGDHSRVLGVIPLGHSAPTAPRGVLVDGHTVAPFAPRRAGARFEHGPRGWQVSAGDAPELSTHDAVQGALVTAESLRGDDTPRRWRVLTHANGRLSLIEGEATGAELASTLGALAVERGVSLDATSPEGAARWSGGGEALRDAYGDSGLYVLGEEPESPTARLESILRAR